MANAGTVEDEVLEKMNTVATLFPFVCGICYEKFNKIDIFYLHLQAHNQNTSHCFHICDYSQEGDQGSLDPKAARNIFRCGSCSKTFFSICTLHKHMQDIYDQGSYEFDQNTNTAFPRGEVGSTCSVRDSSVVAGFSKSDLEVSKELLCENSTLEGTYMDNTKIRNAKLKQSGSNTNKSRKKPENKATEIMPVLDKEAAETNNEAKCETNVNSKLSKQGIAAESVNHVKRPRGRPPKNRNHIAKGSYSLNSKVKFKASALLMNSEMNHDKQSKTKAIKLERLSENQRKKRTVNKLSKNKSNKKVEEKLDESQKKTDLMPTQENDYLVNVYKDKNAQETDTVNGEQTHTKIRSKSEEKNAETKTDTDSMKENVRKKRKKHSEDQNDGSTETKKVKKYFYTCDICKKTMGLSHKKRHNAIHAAAVEGKPKHQDFETCDICGKSVVKAGLKLHQALHSEDRPYLCDRCPKAFKLKSNLHHHKQIHEDFKPHPCETCGKRFHRRTDLRFHLRVHTDERPVQCPQCPLRFRKTSTLNIHMKVHRGDKCYQCELCGKAFIRKDYLKRHMVWHNGHASHECQVCGKKFMEKGGLQRHEKIHRDEKSHVCHICGKAFVLAANMKQHVKKIHSGDKEKKKSNLNNTTDDQEQMTDARNQSEGTSQNLPVLQECKESIPVEKKTEQKTEYHTLMPRIGEFELPTLTPMGQPRNYGIPQEFTSAQPSFYSTAPVGIVQLPYHDGHMMSHISLPARQVSEMNGDIQRLVYTEQQQAVQSISMQYAIADDSMQYTNM